MYISYPKTGKYYYFYKCKECVNLYCRERRKLPKVKERNYKYALAYIEKMKNNPEFIFKTKVRDKTRQAIRLGKLKREPCEVCGKKKVDAHHIDYSRPFDIKWLCRDHHAKEHIMLR